MSTFIHYWYPFPNARFVFLVFTGVPTILLLSIVWSLWPNIVVGSIGDEQIITLVSVILFATIASTVATIIANAYPDIRERPDGLEIGFLFFFLRRWIFLPWQAIDHVSPHTSPHIGLRKNIRKPTLIVFSNKLPMFYHLATLWFGLSLRRGFFINGRIRRYDELVEVLEKLPSRIDEEGSSHKGKAL